MPKVEVKEKKDWLPAVAVTLGVVGIGTGLYLSMKKPPEEVKAGEWAQAETILARTPFSVTITTEEAGWAPANQELSRKPFQVNITEVVPGIWLPAYTELERKAFQVNITEVVPGIWLPAYTELERKTFQLSIIETILLINFEVMIWGIPADFGSYTYWACYYWDPGIANFVGDGKWYRSYERIPIQNVQQPGGYLAVFLLRDSTMSKQYTSPTFSPVNGGSYQYDVQLGRIVKLA